MKRRWISLLLTGTLAVGTVLAIRISIWER